MKKVIILIIVIVLLLLGVGYFFFFNQNNTTNTPNSLSIRDFIPFGNGGGDPIVTETPIIPEPTIETPVVITALRQLYASPVSGATTFEQQGLEQTETVVRFMERSTGHIFDINVNEQNPNRVSNTTIPKSEESLFISTSTLLVRSFEPSTEVVQTLFGKITLPNPSSSEAPASEFSSTETTYLSPNIAAVAISPAKNKIISLFETQNGAQVLSSNTNGAAPVTIFSSPIREWNAWWPKADTIVLATKGSVSAQGMVVSVNTTTGAQKTILDGVSGLSALPNGPVTKILYSESNIAAPILKIHNVATAENTLLPTKPTLPEKCVWSSKNADIVYCAIPNLLPQAPLPDTWYAGEVSFSDSLWKINTTTFETQEIANIESLAKKAVDAIDLQLSSSETHLIFRNKSDLSLWSFDLQTI